MHFQARAGAVQADTYGLGGSSEEEHCDDCKTSVAWSSTSRRCVNTREDVKRDQSSGVHGTDGEVDVILERWSNCDCNIPMTIVHGDLNVMNIIVDADEKEKITFIDFAYTLVSHPFIDFAYFVSSVEAEDGDMEDYLRLWMEYV
eukprot:IDg2788t1